MEKITVKVEGMMCPMCEAHVNEAIRNAMETKSISSSHKDAQTVIIAKSIDEVQLRSVIEATGYKVLEIATEPYEKKCFLAKLFKK